MAKKLDLSILQGKTFVLHARWGTIPLIYKSITAMQQTAPARVTASGHGIPDGWQVAVVGAKGMTELNAVNNPLKDADFRVATVVDSNTVEFNNVSAAGFKAYVSGGYLAYYTPMSLASYTARMKIKDKVGGTVLETLTTENGGITLNNTNKLITITISATATAAYAWKNAVYDLELASGDATPVVTALLFGKVTVTKEVTT